MSGGMKVVCFGEIMLRLSPPGYERFTHTDTLELTFGGAEANVAVALSNFEVETSFVTKLPDNELGQAAVNSLRRYGVGVSDIVRGGDRTGVYFVEKGASQRPSKVIYDRKNSAIALSDKSEFDWNRIFDGAGWFHITGITPALGDNVTEAAIEACEEAKKRGVTISFDLNYRKNLWSMEKASVVLKKLAGYADMFFCGYDDPAAMFGIKSEYDHAEPTDEDFCSLGRQLNEKFGMTSVVFSLRESFTASNNEFAAKLFYAKSGECYTSRNYHLHIVDRIGGGDALDAGMIYAKLRRMSCQESIEFGAASAAFKHSVEGDMASASVPEIENLVKTGGSGRVQR